MLLLILFAGCLTACAAQTTSFPSSGHTNMTATIFNESSQATLVQATVEPEFVAILQASVQSYLSGLNETTLGPALNKLHDLIIQELKFDPGLTLTIKKITKV